MRLGYAEYAMPRPYTLASTSRVQANTESCNDNPMVGDSRNSIRDTQNTLCHAPRNTGLAMTIQKGLAMTIDRGFAATSDSLV